MAFRAVRLPPAVPGRLWLSSMPGRWEAWPDFLDEAERVGLALTVCLTASEEIAALSPAYRAALDAEALPGRWLHVPVRDFGVPGRQGLFGAAVDEAVAALHRADAVLLHCAAGIGRTGLAAACVLKRLGLPTADALQRVREAGSNPETALQAGLIDRF